MRVRYASLAIYQVPRIKATGCGEGKRVTTPSGSLYRSQRCQEGKADQPDVELVPLSVAVAQPKMLLTVRNEDPSKAPSRLSLVLELESCSGDEAGHHGAGEAAPRPVTASIDSPHPIKHCQLRSSARERVTLMASSGLPDFVLQSEGKL